MSPTSASRKPERRGHALSRPGRALARRADGNARRSRTWATTRRAPRDCLPSQLERTTGRARAPPTPRWSGRRRRRRGARSNRQYRSRARGERARASVGLAEFPVYDPQTGVARDPWVTEAAMCVRLVDVRITCGLHEDAQIAAVFIDPRAK